MIRYITRKEIGPVRKSAVAALVVVWSGVCSAQQARDGRAAERLRQLAIAETNVMVPVRDGVKLATDISRPKREGRFPVLLSRTPYGKRPPGAWAARTGCAMAVQDCRGRYASQGEFYPFVHDLDDAYDTIEWLARQPWCDGRVLMTGGSYVGYTQLAAALARPPHLRFIMPGVPPSDFDARTLFHGGALRMELVQGWMLGQSWCSQRVLRKQVPADELARWQPHRPFGRWCRHLPLVEPGPIGIGGPGYANCWRDIITNWENPTQWRRESAGARPEAIHVPVLVTGGFYDIFAQENIELVLALRQRGGSEAARRHSHLIIGPWAHGIGRPAGDVHFEGAQRTLQKLKRQWMQRRLRKQEPDGEQPRAMSSALWR